MPYRDGSGPMGNGRPGRGMGPCGRGGRGFCQRGQAAAPYQANYQYTKENLQAQKEELEAQLNWLNKELEK